MWSFYVKVQSVTMHCITSIQETKRRTLVLWLRNGTGELVDAVNSCSVGLETKRPEE